ncbi:MAG: hypothetical protein IPH53_07835 [Flavobacteriales bacterium]|nr:hypothetical protein [Flavobacteriales bacterium]
MALIYAVPSRHAKRFSTLPTSLFSTIAAALLNGVAADAQDGSQVHGNFSMVGQYYREDSVIGANKPPQTWGLNSWGNINYASANGTFKAGLRFEAYEPALLGYPAGQAYQGNGIGYRYASYTKDDLEVTVGNFYEQFGQGLAFRSYEERYLGVDNAMDGVRLKFRPDTGIYLKGFIGQQRLGFEGGTTKLDAGEGIVRGFDAEISLTEAWPRCFPKWVEKGKNLTLGGSFVSKYQSDAPSGLEFPENVGTWAGRLNYTTAKWNLYSEYAHKINDPNGSNGFIYKDGEALLVNATYSTQGLGVSAGAHSYDNMVYQSDRVRARSSTSTSISSLRSPSSTPITCRPRFIRTPPRPTVRSGARSSTSSRRAAPWVGPRNEARRELERGLEPGQHHDPDDTVHFDGYRSNIFSPGKRNYYQDFNIELPQEGERALGLRLSYLNFVYDIEQVQGKPASP